MGAPWIPLIAALLVAAPFIWDGVHEGPWEGAAHRDQVQLLMSYYALLVLLLAALVGLVQVLDAMKRRESAELRDFLARYNSEDVLVPLWSLTDRRYPEKWRDFRKAYSPATTEYYQLTKALNFLNEYCGEYLSGDLSTSSYGSLDSAVRTHARNVLSYVFQRRVERGPDGSYRFNPHHGANIEDYVAGRASDQHVLFHDWYAKIYCECLAELATMKMEYRSLGKCPKHGVFEFVESPEKHLQEAVLGRKPRGVCALCEEPPP